MESVLPSPSPTEQFARPDITPARMVFDETGASALEVHPNTPDAEVVIEGLYRAIVEGPALSDERQTRVEGLLASLRGNKRFDPTVHGEHALNPQSIKREEKGPIVIQGDDWKLASAGLAKLTTGSNEPLATADLLKRIDTARTDFISGKQEEAALAAGRQAWREESSREKNGTVSSRHVLPPPRVKSSTP